MRTVSYKCDRCGKPMTGRAAVKIAITLQRGVEPVEKSTLDFCQKCFVKVKTGYALSLTDTDMKPAEQPKAAAREEAVEKPVLAKEPVKASGRPAKVVGPVVEDGKSVRFTVETKVLKKQEEPAPEEEPVQEEKPADKEYAAVVMGPLSKEEHAEILRLYVEEGLDPETIAARMRRLPKGVKRCINSAQKSGDLDRLKAEYEARQKPVPEAIEDVEPEGSAGTGVSNSGIMKDAYTAPPQTEVVEGKRHDIGAILALAKAGWDPKTIASEKHYDEDIVRMLLEKYMGT